MRKKEVVIAHKEGLHTRPALALVKKASDFDSAISLYNVELDIKADAKSMVSVLMLEASCGTRLMLITDGKDEEEAIESISKLLENEE